MTLMTSLTHPRGFVTSAPRQGTNTSVEFFEFIAARIADGHLLEGDILVADNARIHTAADLLDELLPLLDQFGIRLVFLPTYSPELNPVERCWAFVKNRLRATRDDSVGLDVEVVAAFEGLTWDHIFSFYDHCVNQKERLLIE